MTLKKLSRAAKGLTPAQFEAIAFNLSPQERRMFGYLIENGTSNTIELREQCALGNISQTKTSLNAKLAAAGDDRRVFCEVRTIENRYNESGTLGYWTLTEAPTVAANDE